MSEYDYHLNDGDIVQWVAHRLPAAIAFAERDIAAVAAARA